MLRGFSWYVLISFTEEQPLTYLTAPTFIAITTMWWRRSEQTYRNASWYAMNGVTTMVSYSSTSKISADSWKGWKSSLIRPWPHPLGQAVFLPDHLPDLWSSHRHLFCFSVVSTASYRDLSGTNRPSLFLPDSPVEAKFLNDHDKILAVERLRDNQMGVVSTEWKWEHVIESLLDIKTWCWFALIFSIS